MLLPTGTILTGVLRLVTNVNDNHPEGHARFIFMIINPSGLIFGKAQSVAKISSRCSWEWRTDSHDRSKTVHKAKVNRSTARTNL